MELIEILSQAVHLKASDIHLVVDKPPMVRVNGFIRPLPNYPVLTAEDTKMLIYSMLYQDQIARFEERLELDMSYFIPGLSRFRVNVLSQKNGIEAALRLIPSKIPSPAEIKLSDAILSFTKLPRGLVLVTGPTGTGKTTTLASMLNVINNERYEHILTIEEPIEYVYDHKKCIVRQREVGLHTHSFAEALKHALRQDPDVILVGEMRDLETISLALTAAETGHLVFSTLHTQDAPQTVDRIIDVFPPHQQHQVRAQLAATLKGVISQQLLPRADGRGRIAAREVMIVTPAISNLIREGKTHQIYGSIETGLKYGMHTLETALAELVRDKLIRIEDAFAKANNPDLLRLKLSAMGIKSTQVTATV
ncbi:MAG: type IV pilus twitching motility protein PilT [Thermodesulfovibrionales bacterium]|nr:type IV pilus twitching motility protein PilT [Thermodesulfovibrionales bacterium]